MTSSDDTIEHNNQDNTTSESPVAVPIVEVMESDRWYFKLDKNNGILDARYFVDTESPQPIKQPMMGAISNEAFIDSLKAKFPLLGGWTGFVKSGELTHNVMGSILLRFPYSQCLIGIYRFTKTVGRNTEQTVVKIELEDMIAGGFKQYGLNDRLTEGLSIEDLLLEAEIWPVFETPNVVAHQTLLPFERNSIIDFLRGKIKLVNEDMALIFNRNDKHQVTLDGNIGTGTFVFLEYSMNSPYVQGGTKLSFHCFVEEESRSLLEGGLIASPDYPNVGIKFDGVRFINIDPLKHD